MSEPAGRPSAPVPEPGGPAPPPEPVQPATPPAVDPAAAPPSPPGPPAPQADPGTAAAPAPDAGPVPSRARTLAKAAGLTLIVFGGFFALLLGPAVALLAQPGQVEAGPGGTLLLTVPSGAFADVTLGYPDGSRDQASTDENGTARLQLKQARFELTVQSGGRTATRSGLVPAGVEVASEVKMEEPAGPAIGLDRDALGYTLLQSAVLLAINLLAIVGGVAAFRLKGLRLAVAGALLFFVQAGYFALTILPGLQGLVFAVTAGLALFFVFKARPLFAPWPAPWRRA